MGTGWLFDRQHKIVRCFSSWCRSNTAFVLIHPFSFRVSRKLFRCGLEKISEHKSQSTSVEKQLLLHRCLSTRSWPISLLFSLAWHALRSTTRASGQKFGTLLWIHWEQTTSLHVYNEWSTCVNPLETVWQCKALIHICAGSYKAIATKLFFGLQSGMKLRTPSFGPAPARVLVLLCFVTRGDDVFRTIHGLTKTQSFKCKFDICIQLICMQFVSW